MVDCKDEKCARHGKIKVRGNIFVGVVRSAKAPKTAIVEREITHFLSKFERYKKTRSKIAAHNPACINAKEGDIVRIGETRKLSKTKAFSIMEIVGKEKYDGKEAAQLKKELDAKKGKCPRCSDGTLLAKKEYRGKYKIDVDMCPKGHGIWLDGGEIEGLRKRGLVNLKERVQFYLELIYWKEKLIKIRKLTGRIRRSARRLFLFTRGNFKNWKGSV